MIIGMIIWEAIFIMIYLFYKELGQGWAVISFIQKTLLFLSEIVPCLFICLAVFYMKYSNKNQDSDRSTLEENDIRKTDI